MDIEWAKDGVTGELFIVQARPETVHSAKSRTAAAEMYRLTADAGPPLRHRTGRRRKDRRRAACVWSATSARCRPSRPAKCWSPRLPTRTGNR